MNAEEFDNAIAAVEHALQLEKMHLRMREVMLHHGREVELNQRWIPEVKVRLEGLETALKFLTSHIPNSKETP